MPGQVRHWLDGWRGVPIDVRSPLPLDQALDRLRAAAPSRWRPSVTLNPNWLGNRRVKVRVTDHHVRLEVRNPAIRNSWQPIARCTLEPDGPGCRLLGTLRARWAVLAFSAFWLTGVGLAALVSFLATLVTLVTGDFHDAAPAATVLGATTGMAAFGVLLFGFGFALGRRDATFLHAWLTEHLQAAPARSTDPNPT